MNKKLIAITVIGLVIAIAAGLLLRRDPARAPLPVAQAPVPAVRADADTLRFLEGAAQLTMLRSEVLQAMPLPLSDALSARLVFDEDATARIGVGVAGRMVAIRAAPGDTVQAGAVLAEVDAPDLGTARADLDKARADEERKRLAVQRARELVPGDAIATKDWEALQADLAQAHAETLRAAQRLKNLDPGGLAAEGQRLRLTSPIAGLVADRTATLALEVGPGMAAPLFTVTDPRRLWLLIDMPERLAAQVQRGSAVEVTSDAFPGESFAATVVQRGQMVDTNTRRVTVRARLANLQGKLLPEMFVRARVLQTRGRGVRVPNGAIVNQGLFSFVFVQTGPAEFKRRHVTLLTQGSDSSYVGDGLLGGERVLTTGALLLDAELSARAGDKP